MTPREFYLERRRAELPAFLKVLMALPAIVLITNRMIALLPPSRSCGRSPANCGPAWMS